MTRLRLVADELPAQPDDLISSALDETLLVEAGAGTGKTRALVDRVIALVRSGTPIDKIIAITFTERAAAELRERIRIGLEAGLAAGGDRDAFDAALAALDRAQISTIHAFALTQLRAYAAEARIDPDFRVLDEVQAQRRLQERRREFLEGLGEVPDAIAAFDRALALGLTPGNVNELIEKLFMNPDIAPLVSGLEAPEPHWPDLNQAMRDLNDCLVRAPEGDKLASAARDLLHAVDDVRSQPEQRDAVLAFHGKLVGRKYGNVGNKQYWGGADRIDHVRSVMGELSAQLGDALAAAKAKALTDVLHYVATFVRDDSVVRGREGVLTFDDLIIKLRDLLRDSPFAATALRERYDVLMIDEFQDTDPAQVEIALSFARHPGTADVEPGRVFLVGDPKQSIYRFRKADMSVYAQTRELISMADGKFPVLSRNRRSRQPIIDWVNATFMKLFGSGDEPNVQPPYVGIEPARTGPSMSIAGPGVAFFGNEDSNKAQDVYRKEARAIASLCHMILKEGWQVEDDGEVRRAGLRDIAILMPTRASLVSLERSLGDAQVPYRVESGSLVYRTQEVRDLINCLTAIDDPSDEVAIVGGLRSPAFACSDVDLARHRSGGGRWNYLSPDLDDRDGPVADALRVLRDYHRLRRDHSLAALVERFTSARGFAEIDVLDQDSRNSFRRMRFVAEQARRFEESAPESLRAFVSWLEHLATGTVIDQEGAGLEDDEDAARILTIHAAKGLEFPIVIMTGLAHRPSGRAEMFMADMANGDVAVAVRAQGRNESTFNFQAGPAEELREVEKRHSLAEANRLLYVAATRARDHLVISLYHSANSAKGCAAQRLIEHGAREGAVELVVPGGGELARAAPFDGLTVDPAPVALAEFDERRSALVEGARQQRYTSATALGPQVERKEHADDDTEPWARGRGGTHLGRAVHAAIQSLPLDAGDDAVRASSRAQAVAEAIPDRAAEVTRLVGRALSSAAAGRARKATRALREVPFAMSQDGVILEGFVDLVIEADGGIEIVDWKTDDVNEKEIEERLRSYELQAGLYILGLERATGRPVRAVTYVFVRPGIERSPGAPDALREQALSRLAEAAIST